MGRRSEAPASCLTGHVPTYFFLVKVRDLIAALEDDGWRLVRTKGSHRQFRHPTKPGTVTVAGKMSIDVPVGTLGSIWKQARLKKD
jgi:predicted RNA binding protein YcfA (HicA-like mRNA interferase family)